MSTHEITSAIEALSALLDRDISHELQQAIEKKLLALVHML